MTAHGKSAELAKLRPHPRTIHGNSVLNRAEQRKLIKRTQRDLVKNRWKKTKGGRIELKVQSLKDDTEINFIWTRWRFGWTNEYSTEGIILNNHRWKRLFSKLYWRQWRVFK